MIPASLLDRISNACIGPRIRWNSANRPDRGSISTVTWSGPRYGGPLTRGGAEDGADADGDGEADAGALHDGGGDGSAGPTAPTRCVPAIAVAVARTAASTEPAPASARRRLRRTA